MQAGPASTRWIAAGFHHDGDVCRAGDGEVGQTEAVCKSQESDRSDAAAERDGGMIVAVPEDCLSDIGDTIGNRNADLSLLVESGFF